MNNAIKTTMFSGFFGSSIANYFTETRKQESNSHKQQRQKRISLSPQFKNGKAVNRMPNVPYKQSNTSLLWNFLFKRSALKPKYALSTSKVDLNSLNKRTKELRATWLGHSSLFIEVNDTRLLLDPVFQFASPLIAKPFFDRNVASPVDKESLPQPDLIIISHDHYDHLEKSTIKYYADKSVQFYVPLGVGRHLQNWGVAADKIIEFDWWESAQFNGIKLTATPANHNSGRIGIDNNKTLWCSWAIQSENGSAFFSGDTAYDNHFKEINQRLGRFDIAFIEVAANVKEGIGVPVENCGHMQARHTVQAFQDLRAEKLMPIHWSTFELFAHQWNAPIFDLISDADEANIPLVTPKIGETIKVNEKLSTCHWWLETETAANSPHIAAGAETQAAEKQLGWQEYMVSDW